MSQVLLFSGSIENVGGFLGYSSVATATSSSSSTPETVDMICALKTPQARNGRVLSHEKKKRSLVHDLISHLLIIC